MEADVETLTAVDGVGTVIAESLLAWWTVPTNRALVEKLRAAGVALEGPEPETPDLEPTLAGRTFVLTGGLEEMTREDAEAAIAAAWRQGHEQRVEEDQLRGRGREPRFQAGEGGATRRRPPRRGGSRGTARARSPPGAETQETKE